MEQGLQGIFCGKGDAESVHFEDFAGGGLRRRLLLADRADDVRSVRLLRKRHHVFLQRHAGSGLPVCGKAACDDQPRRLHPHRLFEQPGGDPGDDQLPVQPGREVCNQQYDHGQSRRCEIWLYQGADDRRLQEIAAIGCKAFWHPRLPGQQHHDKRILPHLGAHFV